jgi:hypothetical protein
MRNRGVRTSAALPRRLCREELRAKTERLKPSPRWATCGGHVDVVDWASDVLTRFHSADSVRGHADRGSPRDTRFPRCRVHARSNQCSNASARLLDLAEPTLGPMLLFADLSLTTTARIREPEDSLMKCEPADLTLKVERG